MQAREYFIGSETTFLCHRLSSQTLMNLAQLQRVGYMHGGAMRRLTAMGPTVFKTEAVLRLQLVQCLP